ncbi:MAG TPA: hypothetical protein VMB18_13710 [Terriglobales bacterium]|nr:hypothetical protein [Terriglobales bacterium]
MSSNARFAVLVLCLSFAVAASLNAQVNVVTSRNDISRDGWNSSETVLNQSNVNSATFGKICSAVVDGQLYAQPLVISILGKNTIFLGTMNGNVYAIDGSNCSQLGHVSLIPANEEPVQCVDLNSGHCAIINPLIGVLSTPVIDIASKTIYVSMETESTSRSCQSSHAEACFIHRLHALDLTTLAEKFNGPVIISGSFGNATFTPREHIQRPGLLELANVMPNGDGAIYLGFAAIAGYGKPGKSIPQGWVFGYDAQNLAATPVAWSSTPNGEGGGVWQSGGGLAAGLDGPQGNTYLYVATGDGTFDVNNGGVDYGDSFLKLTPQLTTVANGFFTPFNQACLDPTDEDFGSGGVLLTPNITSKYYAITASKTGEVFVMDRANPGGYMPPKNHTCPAMGTNRNQEYFRGATHQYFTTPTYWNRYLYYVANQSPLVRYTLSLSCNPGPVCTTGMARTRFTFGVGTLPAISSSGNTSGTAIIWGASGNGWPGANGPAPAVLYALDAEHENPTGTVPELWDSTQCPTRDGAGNAVKFVTPTVANGMVYLGTMDPTDPTNTRGELDVYGLTKAACN